MTGSALQRELPEGLECACQALEKLTGGRWKVESLADGSADGAAEAVEAVRVDVDGAPSPRFLLTLRGPDAGPFAERVNTAFGLGGTVDVPAVLAETANIVVSAVLNRVGERCGETLIVTAPRGMRGEREQLLRGVMAGQSRVLVARLAAPEHELGKIDLITVWDA